MKRTTITLTFGVLFLMLLSSFAIGHAERVQNDYGLDQASSYDHRLVKKDISFGIRTKVIKGENDQGVQLVFSQSGLRRFTNITRGFGNVTFPTNDTAYIVGEGNNTVTTTTRFVKTFIQRDEYVENVTVGKRIRKTGGDTIGGTPQTIQVDKTYQLPASYDELASNSNYTQRQRRGLTIFISRTGELVDVPVNDSNGQEIGRVVAFKFHIHVAAFFEDTKEFVANYESFEFGFGNMIPQQVKDHVKNGTSAQKRLHKGVAGAARLNATKPLVEWINLGYNSTYDLNMSMGLFNFNRKAKLLLMVPIGRERSRPGELALQQSLTTDFEGLIDQYAQANELSELDSMEVDDLDLSLVDEVVSVENIDLDSLASNGKSLPFNFLASLLALFVAIPIIRKFRN